MAIAIMDEMYARVKADHAQLIDGFYALYALFIKLRYLQPHEVLYPPHGQGSRPGLAMKELNRVGFNPEVMALLELLPYPSNEVLDKFSHQEEGLPIAPDSSVVSYLEGQKKPRLKCARKPHPNGETCIPPWAFKIATGGAGFGTNYIYDTRDRSLYRWDSSSQFSEYWEHPSRPSSEGWRVLMNELNALDWIPWRIDHGNFPSMNIHVRPHMYRQHMSSLGTTNRYNCDEDERFEQPSSEYVVLKQVLDDRKHENRALEKALNAAKLNGTLNEATLRQCAVDHGVHLSPTALDKAIAAHAAATASEMVSLPATVSPPQEFAIAWVLQEIDKLGGMTPGLKRAILPRCPSDTPIDAQSLRALAVKSGLPVPELCELPPGLRICFRPERVHRRIEYAKALQNVFLWKRNLYLSCGWADEFNGDEFEERRRQLQDELYDLVGVLGPQALRMQHMEEGRYLREWYRQKAGPLAV
ncbi:hypothetical protein MBLNU459_g0599t1 [Dothideomycetes sp. NU459]